MKIAFIVGRFPSTSETFILNQISGVVERGHEVTIFARKADEGRGVHADILKFGLLERTRYRGRPSKLLPRIGGGVGAFCRLAARRPAVAFGSLNFLRFGQQASSLNLLFAAECFAREGKTPTLALPRSTGGGDKRAEASGLGEQFDIVHAHFGPNGILGQMLRDLGAVRGKLVTSFHGYDVNRYPKQHGAGVYRRLFEAGDAFTANTHYTADKLAGLGCPREKIAIVPESLRVGEFPFAERKLLAGEPIRLITVARLVEKKGLEISIRAAAKVMEKHPSVRYRIVGDGPLRGRLTELVTALGVSDKIELTGWKTQEEVRQLYADSHIFVLASVTASDGDQEGQGLVLQEAQAMGLPVVSTLHNGIPDGVIDGQSGYLVAEGDVDALVERLMFLVEHPEVWAAMGRAGRGFVEGRYDTSIVTERVCEVYERLVGAVAEIHPAGGRG